MPRKPDYRISALMKDGKVKGGNVAGAWINDDRTITIVLNPFVVLNASDNLLITMFPADYRASIKFSDKDNQDFKPLDDDIPS